MVGKLAMSMNQVRYIGEWHSHPREYPLAPSTTDMVQLCRTAVQSSFESLPGLSFIIGDGGLNVLIGEAMQARRLSS